MHDALARGLDRWAKQILGAVNSLPEAPSHLDIRKLAQRLSSAPRWEGCPRAAELFDEASSQYRRIPLIEPKVKGYEALLIVWPPGHATPVHDHDGLWGIELVLDGVLEVEAFTLAIEPTPNAVSQGASILGIGDHTEFSEIDYAHRCRNRSSKRATLSLHIYGGELDSYRAYHQYDEQWHSVEHRTARELALI